MSSIASKNLYELLGNDPEQDPERAPEPPTKVADKPVARQGKRNAPTEGSGGGSQGQAQSRGGRGGSRGGHQVEPLNPRIEDRAERGGEGLRQDRHSVRTRGPREHRGRGERGQGAAGRGFSGRYTRTARDDRSSHTGIADNEKQAAKGWGGEEGNAEWADEKAGEEIARAEANDEPGFTPDTGAGDPAFSNGPGAPGEVAEEDAAPEPEEDKTKSYDQYLAEQAEKRLALGDSTLNTRKANEGSKQKFPEGSAFSRNPEEENFIVGGGMKARREKGNQHKKDTLALDGQYYAPPEAGERGGRGRGRGGRGRGEGRGDRGGRGGDRGRGRGEFRGNRGGDRGGARGGFNANDSSAFPALGA